MDATPAQAGQGAREEVGRGHNEQYDGQAVGSSRLVMKTRAPGRGASKPKKTKFGKDLEESAKLILAHVRGELQLPTRRIAHPDEVGVRILTPKI